LKEGWGRTGRELGEARGGALSTQQRIKLSRIKKKGSKEGKKQSGRRERIPIKKTTADHSSSEPFQISRAINIISRSLICGPDSLTKKRPKKEGQKTRFQNVTVGRVSFIFRLAPSLFLLSSRCAG